MRTLLLAQLIGSAVCFSTSKTLPSAQTLDKAHQSLRPGYPYLSMKSSSGEKSLVGQRVLITGGSRGIGKAIAAICAEQGADVAVMARTSADVQAVAFDLKERYGTKAIAVTGDATREDEIISAVQSAVAQLGSIDLLVNNAGVGCKKAPFYEQSVEEFRMVMDVNAASIFMVSKAVIKQGGMLEAKDRPCRQIINISSRAGKMAMPGSLSYVASKFAVEGITAQMAVDLEGTGIRVNSISPGMVDTDGFPKAPGRAGVRTAESIRDGFLVLACGDMTGKYLHVDELDAAVAKGNAVSAVKDIHEPTFE